LGKYGRTNELNKLRKSTCRRYTSGLFTRAVKELNPRVLGTNTGGGQSRT